MLSVIVIVTWLFSKVSTYPELGQIQNWPKKLHKLPEQPFLLHTLGNICELTTCLVECHCIRLDITLLCGTERNNLRGAQWGREMKRLFILEILLSALFCGRFDCFIVL